MVDDGSRSGRHRHRRDPSEGGWDTSIVKAPDSSKSHKGRRRHKHRSNRRGLKVLLGILIALVAAAALAFGAIWWYAGSVNDAMSLGDDADVIMDALDPASKDEPFYVLLIGSDMRQGSAAEHLDETRPQFANDELGQGSDGVSRSDVIMLLRVDTAGSKLSMLSIPRDTPYMYPDGTINKLNSVYSYEAAPGMIRAVKEFTGIPISSYAEIHGSDLEAVVDNLGGITVDVPMTYDYTTITGERVHLDAGLQHITGAQALALANMRTLYSGNQDSKRQSAARQVVAGIVEAIRDRPAYEIPAAVSEVASCVKTDMKVQDIVDVATKMGSNITIYSGTGPIEGDISPYVVDPVYDAGGPWLCYADDEGWKKVLDAFERGEDPDAVSFVGDAVHYPGQPKETWSQGLVEPD